MTRLHKGISWALDRLIEPAFDAEWGGDEKPDHERRVPPYRHPAQSRLAEALVQACRPVEGQWCVLTRSWAEGRRLRGEGDGNTVLYRFKRPDLGVYEPVDQWALRRPDDGAEMRGLPLIPWISHDGKRTEFPNPCQSSYEDALRCALDPDLPFDVLRDVARVMPEVAVRNPSWSLLALADLSFAMTVQSRLSALERRSSLWYRLPRRYRDPMTVVPPRSWFRQQPKREVLLGPLPPKRPWQGPRRHRALRRQRVAERWLEAGWQECAHQPAGHAAYGRRQIDAAAWEQACDVSLALAAAHPSWRQPLVGPADDDEEGARGVVRVMWSSLDSAWVCAVDCDGVRLSGYCEGLPGEGAFDVDSVDSVVALLRGVP